MSSTNDLRDALLGRDPYRSLAVFAAALGLALIGYLFAAVPALFDRVSSFVATFVLVGGALAATNARLNDGIVGSWLLVFGLVVGWLWAGFVRRPVTSPESVAIPLGFAALAAGVVGTAGYALGRWIDRDASDSGVVADDFRGVLVGPRETAFRWLAVAGGLLISAAAVVGSAPEAPPTMTTVSVPELFFPLAPIYSNPAVGAVIILAWVAVAAVPALRGGGLLVAWVMVFAPLFGGTGLHYLRSGISGGGLAVDVTLAVVAASAFAVVLGSAGFVLGRSLRVVGRSRSATRRSS
ncbi:hypothetical protein [Halobaculum limi]|uniref:hypothetical protein n=1 Tax=Halobaculum limi TaxID=3031916 RepID=UPI002404D13B|nr:hypothetical protein [Halobaculum sp. YSMS11]